MSNGLQAERQTPEHPGAPSERDRAEQFGTRALQWLRLRLRALRAFSFPVTVLPALVAVAAVRPVGQWDWPILVASLLGVVLMHSAGNLLNDYFDFLSGVDSRLHGDRGRPGRLLVHGGLAPADVLAEAVACLLLAGPAAAYLLWRCGPGLIGFGLAGAVGLYAYTGPPLRLKYRAMGELLIFLLLGPLLMLGAAYAQTRQVEWALLPLSVLVGFATTAILVGNNLRDREEDGAAGIKTLAHLAGGRAARALYLLLEMGCVFGLAGLAAAGLAPRILLAGPVLLILLVKALRYVWQDRRLPNIDAHSARFEAVMLLVVLASFVLDHSP